MINTPSNGRHLRPRATAEAELQALLDEIPQWSDQELLHMHRRFGESRLFRVRHAPDADLTDRAKILRNATRSEMIIRGLVPAEQE